MSIHKLIIDSKLNSILIVCDTPHKLGSFHKLSMSKSKLILDFNATLCFISISLISLASSSSSSSSSSDLHRRDPLQHFAFYDGGYNLQNKHYWASAVSTGVHGYAFSGVWMLCGLGCGIFLITKNVCSSTPPTSVNPPNNSNFSDFLLVFLVLLFTFLAMIATGFVIAENQKALQTTNKLKDTILGAGDQARRTIHRINKVMHNIQSLLSPYDQSTSNLLNTTSQQLGNESHKIKEFVHNNEHSIDHAIRALYITNLIVVAVNLLFLVVGVVLVLLHWHPGFFIFIFFCWILTMACWFLTGIDFFFHTFAEDTCTALQEFRDNPVNSSLSSLLPCAHALKSQTVIIALGQTVHDFITQLNLNMKIMPKELGLDETQYQNVFGNKKICDPFAGPPDYRYLAGTCPKHAIPIRELPDILAKFTCDSEISSLESCKGEGKFLPKPTYLMADAYIRSIEFLTKVYPDLENLIHCSFVKDRVSDVVLHQCKPFKTPAYGLWASMLCLSISMVVLVLLWLVKACQLHHATCFSKCSIPPRHEEP